MFDFIEKYYLWFLIVAVVLVLALIGYFVDVKKESEDSPFKKKKIKEPTEATINESNNMENIAINSNMSLNEMINNTNGAARTNDASTPQNNNPNN